jgi:hypothetical protein
VLLVARPRGDVGRGQDPLGEVVDLVEAGPPRDRQLAGAPEVLQRGLLGLPPPPGLVGPLGALVLEVAGHQGPLAGDALADVVDHPLRVGADALHPPGVLEHAPAVALEADLPIGVPDRGDGRGVVRPVLEEPPVALQEPFEEARLVALEAGGEGQVVRPLDDVDRVDLDEAHPLDDVVESAGGRPAAGIVEQPLGAQQQAPGRGGGDSGERGGFRRHGGEDTRHPCRLGNPLFAPLFYAAACSNRSSGFLRARTR